MFGPTAPYRPPALPKAPPPLPMLGGVVDADADAAERPAPRYLLGLDTDLTPLWWDPAHLGGLQATAPAGHGGTTLLRSVAAQALRTGAARVLVLDGRDGSAWADLAGSDRLEVVPAHDGAAPAASSYALADAVVTAVAEVAARLTDHRGQGATARRLVIVDDFEHLGAALRPHPRCGETVRALARVCALGPDAGVHLLTRSHRPVRLSAHGWAPADADTLALGAAHTARAARFLSPRRPTAPGHGRGRWLATVPGAQVPRAVRALDARPCPALAAFAD